MSEESFMRDLGFEPTDAQKRFLAISHCNAPPRNYLHSLPKHHGKTEAKAIDKALRDSWDEWREVQG